MLKITPEAYSKLQNIFDHMKENMNNREVQGFGKVEVIDGGAVLVDVDLPKQEAESAHISTKVADLVEWRASRFQLKPGMTPEEIAAADAELKSWKVWWHTHPFGSNTPTYSSTDHATLEDLAEESGWFIGVVFNEELGNTVYACYSRPISTGVLKYSEEAELDFPVSEVIGKKQEKLREKAEALMAEADALHALPDTSKMTDELVKQVVKKEYKSTQGTPFAGQSQMKNGRNGHKWGGGADSRSWDPRNGAIKRDEEMPKRTFLDYVVDADAKMLNRGCQVCLSLVVAGKERWQQGDVTITNLNIPICVECEIEEELCTCLDGDDKILEFAHANGWLNREMECSDRLAEDDGELTDDTYNPGDCDG